MTNTEIQPIVDEALEAFWDVVVKRFPEAETGDLSPGATIDLQMAAEDAVSEWIANNVTTQDCDIAVGYRFRLFRLNGQETEQPDHGEPTGVVIAVDEEGVWGRMDQPVAGSQPSDHRIHWPTRNDFCRNTVPLST